jgi:aspartokinase/homoserine dehydrogenase 1
LIESVLSKLADLKDIYHGVELVKECSMRSFDLITGFGERLSTAILAQYLVFLGHQAQAFDTSENIIISDDNHGQAQVFFDQSYSNIQRQISSYPGIPVITGFIAVSHTGQPTTLGRNGSDFTASIVGAGLEAEKVEIWTDVDGVLSGDPRIIENTFVIDELSVEEAMELSYFGAEVIHPSTMLPIVEKNIPLWIKNTHNPAARGTLIAREIKAHNREITGVASIPGAALLNIEGGGMIGIPGFASRVFGALAKSQVNIIMISQASSEHSICVVIRQNELEQALNSLESELSEELSQKRIQAISFKKDLEIIAVIGENMRGRPGLSGKLFSALGNKDINILVIVQGSSERNISFVIQESQKNLALNTVHQAFLG